MFPAKGSYFEILILWSMPESIIQSKPFPKDFSIFDICVVKNDSNTSSMPFSFSLIIISAFCLLKH